MTGRDRLSMAILRIRLKLEALMILVFGGGIVRVVLGMSGCFGWTGVGANGVGPSLASNLGVLVLGLVLFKL